MNDCKSLEDLLLASSAIICSYSAISKHNPNEAKKNIDLLQFKDKAGRRAPMQSLPDLEKEVFGCDMNLL